jgi:hypothetical protein
VEEANVNSRKARLEAMKRARQQEELIEQEPKETTVEVVVREDMVAETPRENSNIQSEELANQK